MLWIFYIYTTISTTHLLLHSPYSIHDLDFLFSLHNIKCLCNFLKHVCILDKDLYPPYMLTFIFQQDKKKRNICHQIKVIELEIMWSIDCSIQFSFSIRLCQIRISLFTCPSLSLSAFERSPSQILIIESYVSVFLLCPAGHPLSWHIFCKIGKCHLNI